MSYQQVIGPWATSWPGPQRIVLDIVADRIAAVEQHGGYVARGCAARLAQRPLAETGPLVNRVCGMHGLYHALAWTLALEQLDGRPVPPRAQALRIFAAEAERITSHLQAAATLVELVGLHVPAHALLDLREQALGSVQIITGHRLVHDWVVPGGVQHPLYSDEVRRLAALCSTLEHGLHRVTDQLLKQRGLAHRLAGIGRITAAQVDALGVRGIVARASGAGADVRRDQPYDGYHTWMPRLVQQHGGDVAARLFALLLESHESSVLLQAIVAELPGEAWRGDVLERVAAGKATSTVEAPSGPLSYTLASDGERLTQIEIVGTPLPDQVVLQALLGGQAAEDAALIVASVMPCAACAEG